MPKGNINMPDGDGLFYAGYEAFSLYRNKKNRNDIRPPESIPEKDRNLYVFDAGLSQKKYDAWLTAFREKMRKRFPSLVPADRYIVRNKRVILENQLYEIIVADNGWGIAVELSSKKKYKWPQFQRSHAVPFLRGLGECLLETAGEAYIRTGSWTAEPVTDIEQIKKSVDHARAERSMDAERKIQTANA